MGASNYSGPTKRWANSMSPAIPNHRSSRKCGKGRSSVDAIFLLISKPTWWDAFPPPEQVGPHLGSNQRPSRGDPTEAWTKTSRMRRSCYYQSHHGGTPSPIPPPELVHVQSLL